MERKLLVFFLLILLASCGGGTSVSTTEAGSVNTTEATTDTTADTGTTTDTTTVSLSDTLTSAGFAVADVVPDSVTFQLGYLKGAVVSVYDENGNLITYGTTDDSGRKEIIGLDEASLYKVCATGGIDTDANDDGDTSDSRDNLGTVCGYLTGEEIAQGAEVNPITDIVSLVMERDGVSRENATQAVLSMLPKRYWINATASDFPAPHRLKMTNKLYLGYLGRVADAIATDNASMKLGYEAFVAGKIDYVSDSAIGVCFMDYVPQLDEVISGASCPGDISFGDAPDDYDYNPLYNVYRSITVSVYSSNILTGLATGSISVYDGLPDDNGTTLLDFTDSAIRKVLLRGEDAYIFLKDSTGDHRILHYYVSYDKTVVEKKGEISLGPLTAPDTGYGDGYLKSIAAVSDDSGNIKLAVTIEYYSDTNPIIYTILYDKDLTELDRKDDVYVARTGYSWVKLSDGTVLDATSLSLSDETSNQKFIAYANTVVQNIADDYYVWDFKVNDVLVNYGGPRPITEAYDTLNQPYKPPMMFFNDKLFLLITNDIRYRQYYKIDLDYTFVNGTGQ